MSSVARKNSRRLKKLRTLGVRIDGNYLVAGVTLKRLNVLDFGVLVDASRDLYRIDPRVQRAIVKALA